MTISLLTGLLVSLGTVGQPLLSPQDAQAAVPVSKTSQTAATASMLPTDDPFEARRFEIFQILRGGDMVLEEDVNAHLWRLASSLAATEWKPPRVHIEVAVRKSNG
ncbi:MAG TPA: hypothetical protein VFR10_12630 [bacterium]|nr:hypothetical protein [bacterium]